MKPVQLPTKLYLHQRMESILKKGVAEMFGTKEGFELCLCLLFRVQLKPPLVS